MWGSKRQQRWSEEWLTASTSHLSIWTVLWELDKPVHYHHCTGGSGSRKGVAAIPPYTLQAPSSAGQGRIPVISMLSWSVLWIHGAFTWRFPFTDRLALLPPPPSSPWLRPPSVLYLFLLPELAVWSGLESRVWTLANKSWATHWSTYFPRIGKC